MKKALEEVAWAVGRFRVDLATDFKEGGYFTKAFIFPTWLLTTGLFLVLYEVVKRVNR